MENYDEQLSLDLDFGEAFERFIGVNTKDLESTAIDELDEIPKPFVKWVGGKRRIIKKLHELLPSDISDYYEPFLGGGALYFSKFRQIQTAHLSDVNIDLLLCYQVIKKDSDKLIKLLTKHRENHSDSYYYKIRNLHDLTNPVEIAGRFIYLNKTCFNGLYRVNSKGEFNVPVGKYKNPAILDEENIKACKKALANATIKFQSYAEIKPLKGSFVYFDPPYVPTSETAYFTQYSIDGFSEKDQVKLRDFADKLTKQGVNVMLSNSNMPFVQELYKSYNKHIVDVSRSVNCKPNKRNSVEELVITNYA